MNCEILNTKVHILSINNHPSILYISEFKEKIPESTLIFAFYMHHFHGIKLYKSDFEYTENGKPYLKNKGIFFNSSNKKNISSTIISVLPVGIDIEIINYSTKIDKISKRFFSKNEYDYIFSEKSSKLQYEKFYEIWTKKEAYIKLNSGRVTDINSFDCLEKNIYSFKRKNCVISIAF